MYGITESEAMESIGREGGEVPPLEADNKERQTILATLCEILPSLGPQYVKRKVFDFFATSRLPSWHIVYIPGLPG